MKVEIRKLLGSDKLVIGTDRVLKAVAQGLTSKVFFASNAPAELRERVTRYHAVDDSFTIEEAGLPNDELGTLCKKPFSIAVLAILA